MIPVRAGILLGYICLVLNVTTQAQKVNSIPEVSHQDGLSKTSMFLIGFGSSIIAGWGFEYSPIMRRKLSLDLRGSGSIFPFDRDEQLYHFSLGPHLQVGARTSRFVVGLNYGLRFENSSVGEFTNAGEYVCCKQKLNDISHGIIPTLGYRAQTRHGFFFEIDIHMLLFKKTWYGDGSNWSAFPWGGVLFGYRFPSRAKVMEWRMGGGAPVGTNRRAVNREFRREVKEQRQLVIEDRQLERQFNRSDKKERRIQRDERIKAEFKPVRMDSTSRNYGHVFGEAYGLATWTINYTYSHPFKKVENFGLVARVGAGYTEMLSVPVGIGIQFLKMNNSVSLNTGIVLTSKTKTTVFYYTGFTGHINIYKGLTMGLGGYLLINPHGSHIEFNRRNDISIMMGGSLGYRLGR